MTTATKPKSRAKRIVVISVIVLLVVALLSGGALAAIGISVSNGETILPNITVNGVPVGGLTVSQAADILEESMEIARTERVVVIDFPGASPLIITSEEAGLSINGEQAARVAYRYGRSGNFFANGFAFLHRQIAPVDIDPLTLFPADRNMIRAVVAEAVAEMDHLSMGAYEVVDDHLVVVKGRLVVLFDADTLVDLIVEAFAEGAHQPIRYDADTVEPEPIDLEAIHESLFQVMESAAFDLETMSVTQHVVGVDFDVQDAQRRLNAAQQGQEVFIPLLITQPEFTTEYLESALFRDIIGSSTTRLTHDEHRNHNIVLAGSKIDGLILNPGEQFDWETVVGHANAARGFQPGGAFQGTTLISVIGGGICQTSSTIYHAVLHTDLRVDVRSAHTLTVAYLPLGMDAAVSWGGPHFSFTNTSPFPIRIDIWRDGLDFNVNLVGTRTHAYTIVPESVYINSVAFGTTYRDDASFPAGTYTEYSPGRIGHVVEVFRRFYDADGNFIRREFENRSSYWATARVMIRGTGLGPGYPGSYPDSDAPYVPYHPQPY
ncbi:MAG: VanW family protein [Oscillospiraceae bacterium]|nr:VanW family protein [Oscillospiraceae bacterium]